MLQLQSIFFWNFIEDRMLADELFATDSDSDDSDFLDFY